MKFLLLVPLVLFFGIVPSRAEYGCREKLSTTYPLTADGVVGLWNVNGNVVVRTWDRTEVKVEAEKSAKTQEELQLIDLSIDPKADRLAIAVKLPKRPGSVFGGSEIRAAVNFTVTVPANAKLEEVQTVNGDVRVEGALGPVRAGSVNGGVKALETAGDLALTSTNGSVDATVAHIGSGQKLRASSVNGTVTLRLPATAGASLNASVVNGHVDCDFPIQMTGRIGGHSVHGSIGDGSAEIKASTVNGNIRILKRGGK